MYEHLSSHVKKNLLAIETCGLGYSIAIMNGIKLVAEHVCDVPHRQCEELVTKIELMLLQSRLTYKDIDVIAVTTGPGSFSGVRIGSSVAYGISIGQNIGVIGINTIDMMLYRFLYSQTVSDQQLHIAVVYDCGNDNFYAKEFDVQYTDTKVHVNSLNNDPILLSHDALKVNKKQIWRDHEVIQFDVNAFNTGDATISNAYATGVAAIHNPLILVERANKKMLRVPIFYGRPPSIHKSSKAFDAKN